MSSSVQNHFRFPRRMMAVVNATSEIKNAGSTTTHGIGDPGGANGRATASASSASSKHRAAIRSASSS